MEGLEQIYAIFESVLVMGGVGGHAFPFVFALNYLKIFGES